MRRSTRRIGIASRQNDCCHVHCAPNGQTSRYHSPPRDLSYPLFPIAPPTSKRTPIPRATRLNKKERPIVEAGLLAFGIQVFEAEMFNDSYQRRVKSWFFPPSLQDKLTDSVLRLVNPNDLDVVLKQEDWQFRGDRHQANLWEVIKGLQATVTCARARSGKKSAQGRATASLSESASTAAAVSTSDYDSTTLATSTSEFHPTTAAALTPLTRLRPRQKRALEDVTNERVVKARTTDTRTVKQLHAELGPARTSYRRPRNN